MYVHFDDLEDLFCVAARRAYGRVAPILEPAATTGPLRDRAEGLVRRRVQLYARMGSVARATQLQAPFSPTLARILRDAHRRSCREIERVFAPELEPRAPVRRARVVAALDVLISAQSWETLRELHGLPPIEAIGCVVESVVATVEATE